MSLHKIICYLVLPALFQASAIIGGNGTFESPFQISTASGLESVNNDLSAFYILVNNIDLSGNIYDRAIIAADEDVDSYDYYGYGFRGVLNGNRYKIFLPDIDSPYNYVGLFGCIDSGGMVINLGLEGGEVRGQDFVGAIAGINLGRIENSYSKCNVSAEYYGGGLAGMNFGIISRSYSNAEVEGDFFIGGITGINQGYSIYTGKIFNSYSTGTVTGLGDIGGFIGNNYGYISYSYSSSQVSSPPAAEYVGGFGGWHSANYGFIDTSFWNSDISASDDTPANPMTDLEMQDVDSFLDHGWDFVNETDNGTMNLWYIAGANYPKLHWEASFFDLNYDGVVDEKDMLVIAREWLMSSEVGTRLQADTNKDGKVDYIDFKNFVRYYMMFN